MLNQNSFHVLRWVQVTISSEVQLSGTCSKHNLNKSQKTCFEKEQKRTLAKKSKIQEKYIQVKREAKKREKMK